MENISRKNIYFKLISTLLIFVLILPFFTAINSYKAAADINMWRQEFFAPYVDNTMTAENFPEYINETGVNQFTFAFINSDGNGNPAWGGYTTMGLGKGTNDAQIDAIRQSGGDIMISLGGAIASPTPGTRNADLAVEYNTAEELADVFMEIIDFYDLTAIDFDVEGAMLGHNVANARRSQAMKIVQERMAAQGREIETWITLPVMQSGLTHHGIDVIKSFIASDTRLDGINIMAMDYGNGERDMANAAKLSTEATKNDLAKLYPAKTSSELYGMIGVTPMIGIQDTYAVDADFTLDDARELLEYTKEKEVRMVAIWSLKRDKAGSYQVSPLHSGQNQELYEYSSIFSAHDADTIPMVIENVPPTVPTNLSLESDTYGVTITFSPATDNDVVSGYEIYRDNQLIATTATTSYFDSDVLSNGDYVYKVRAYDRNNNYSSFSSVATVTTGDVYVNAPTWDSAKIYYANDLAEYQGEIYRAKHWTQDTPGTSTHWELHFALKPNKDGSTPEPTNTAPVFSGVSDVNILVGSAFNPMIGVVATDAEDGNLTSSVTVTGTVDTSKAGTYTLTYSVTDSDGETVSVTRVITVVAEEQPVDPEPEPDPDLGDLPVWNSTDSYVGGTRVQHNGKVYEAKWWTQGHDPELFEGPEGDKYWLLVE